MAGTIKVRASLEGGATTVKLLIDHPMETGLRKDKATGQTVPAHFIHKLTVEHAGKTVLAADWGSGVAANPYLAFRFKGGKQGDPVKVSWQDIKGGSDSAETKIG
jgi:sulfur-oxidizing protein SoxZ